MWVQVTTIRQLLILHDFNSWANASAAPGIIPGAAEQWYIIWMDVIYCRARRVIRGGGSGSADQGEGCKPNF